MLRNTSLLVVVSLLLASVCWLPACRTGSGTPKVLVFSKTKGWHHTSIPNGQAAIRQIGQEKGFEVDTTSDATVFTDENLRTYRAVIFDNTTGNVLNAAQQA